MALKCYPLQPGGLLAIEAVLLGMTSPEAVYHETAANFQVILLLMFMVAGIYFMRDMLLFVFTKILLGVNQNHPVLLILFCRCCLISIPRRTYRDSGTDYYLSGLLFGLSQGRLRQENCR